MKYIFGDPLFANPEEGDFSFRPGSPALALGIEPLNVSKMGRLDDRSLRISDGSRFVPKDFFILSLAGRPRRAISCLETRTVCCVRSKFVSLPSKRVFSVLKSHMAWENSGEVDIGRLGPVKK